MKGTKLGVKSSLCYGIGAIGEGIGYNVFFSFFTYFLTTQAGIAPAIAGVISGIAVLWDAITDPIIGSWSDNTRNPKGRRRPFIMTGSILFGVAVALLFLNVNISGALKPVYYIAVNMLYWLAMTTCVIPHISLGSELTEDFDERTKLRTYAVTFMGIGTLIAVGTPLLLVGAYEKLLGSASAGWALAGVTYGALTALAYQICCRALKGKEPENPMLKSDAPELSKKEMLSQFFANAKKAFENKALVRLVLITFFVNIVVTLGSGLAIYLFKYVFVFSDEQSSLVYTLQGVLVIAAAVVMGIAATKLDKKLVMSAGIVLYMLSYMVIIIFPVAWSTIVVSVILFALGNSGYWTMIYAMSYDASLVQQLKSGERPDGLYTSLIGLFMKFGNALGSVVVGVGLQLIGFSEAVTEQSAGVAAGIRWLYAVAPAVVLAIGLIFSVTYPLTRKRYTELSEQAKLVENGGELDALVLEGL